MTIISCINPIPIHYNSYRYNQRFVTPLIVLRPQLQISNHNKITIHLNKHNKSKTTTQLFDKELATRDIINQAYINTINHEHKS